METKNELYPGIAAKDRMIQITRIFDAPKELVFEAWTNAKHLLHWFSPNDCTMPFCKIDFRIGGVFHYCIQSPGGDCWCKGFFKEIIPNEKISFTMAFCDEQGNFVDSSPVGKDPDWPIETIVTVTFQDLNGKTKLTLHQTALESVAKRTGAYPSWLQMLDRLEKELNK